MGAVQSQRVVRWIEWRHGFVGRLGAMSHLVLGGGGVWGAGLNLSAVAIAILLYMTARNDVAVSPAPDGAPSAGG
jgi:hypothetical protein